MSRIANTLGALALTAAAATGCADDQSSDGFVLEDGASRADSISGYSLALDILEEYHVTAQAKISCSRTSGEPWLCGNNEAGAFTNVLVNDETVLMSGSLIVPVDTAEFFVFDVKHEGFGLGNLRNVKYGQVLFARGASDEWTRLDCGARNIFSERVVVNHAEGTIETPEGEKFELESCGATASDEIGSFPIPVSRWFSLEGRYDYDVTLNKP